MTRIFDGIRKLADGIAVLMLTAMFLLFCIQIISRYFFNNPLGWSLEVCLTLWLWLIFLAGAFCLRSSDHIRFDILYENSPRKLQRVFFLITAIVIIVGFGISFLPTWDYILFYKIKKSAVLKLRLDYVFSIYGVFLGVIIMRYVWEVYRFFRPNEAGGDPGINHPETEQVES